MKKRSGEGIVTKYNSISPASGTSYGILPHHRGSVVSIMACSAAVLTAILYRSSTDSEEDVSGITAGWNMMAATVVVGGRRSCWLLCLLAILSTDPSDESPRFLPDTIRECSLLPLEVGGGTYIRMRFSATFKLAEKLSLIEAKLCGIKYHSNSYRRVFSYPQQNHQSTFSVNRGDSLFCRILA